MSNMVVVSRRIPLSEATEKEKINFAKKNRKKSVLDELAKDKSLKVRLALFQNLYLPYETVNEILEKDSDTAIQLAVRKYWDKKIDCNLIFVHLINAFFSKISDLSDEKVKKAITALFYIFNQKYGFIYQDERGDCIYFDIQSPTSFVVQSKELKYKFIEIEYLCKHKYQMFEDKIKYQDKVFEKVKKVRKWFDETKRPEGLDDFEWLISLGEFAMAKQKNMLKRYMRDEKYSYAKNAISELYSY